MTTEPQPLPTLHDIQASMMDAILTGAFERATPFIVPAGGAVELRLGIHRTNALAKFEDALRSTFPVLWRLVGADYFHQAARQFHGLHPSASGDLADAGAAFPRFLSNLHGAGKFAYLADVARLEWLIQEALLASDHPCLDLAALGRVSPDAYGALRFDLHPASRLFESKFPALRIWEENVRSEAEPALIELDSGGDRLIILRRRLQLRFLRLGSGELGFLECLRRGANFADAIEAGVQCDPAFDAAAVLQRFVAAEAIVAFAFSAE